MDKLALILLVIVSVSCSEKKTATLPLEEEKVVAIIADVRIAEEMRKPFLTADRDSAMSIYMDSIYRIHQIDSTVFYEMISVLEADTKLLESVEVKVHARLKKMLDDVDVK